MGLIYTVWPSGRGSRVWRQTSVALPGRWWCNVRRARAVMQEVPPPPDQRCTGGGGGWSVSNARWRDNVPFPFFFFFFSFCNCRVSCHMLSFINFFHLKCIKVKTCNYWAVFFLTFILCVYVKLAIFHFWCASLSPSVAENKVDCCNLRRLISWGKVETEHPNWICWHFLSCYSCICGAPSYPDGFA